MTSPFKNGAGLSKEWVSYGLVDPLNSNASEPRITTRHQCTTEKFLDSDFWLMDASFLRLKNIQIAYDFPTTLVSSLGVKQARVFVNRQNLITFPKVKGFDPERTITQNNYD